MYTLSIADQIKPFIYSMRQMSYVCLIRSEVINFTINDPTTLELGLPENFITYNYVATFLIENLSDSAEEITDKEYTIEEVHSDDDGISKLTVVDPHR